MNLILFGPPGAGKGTQASLICKEFNLIPISTGDLLRSEIKKKTNLGKKIDLIGTTLVLMKDGKILQEQDFFDNYSLLSQLGLTPTE